MSLYDLRYGEGYRKKVAIARQQLKKVRSLCACCMKNKFEELHHTEYGVKEVLGKNWFGICLSCHDSICHSKQNWIVDRDFPELLNRNTPEFVAFLKKNYLLLQNNSKKL